MGTIVTHRRWLLAAVATLALSFLVGCKSTGYVATPEVRTLWDSVYVINTQHDSVYIHDSVYVRALNDTVWSDRWRTEYREVVTRDTVYIERGDTVRIVVAADAAADDDTSWLEKACYWTGVVILSIIGLAIVAGLVFLAIKIVQAIKD